ncbi:Alanyl-tRNA synthetase [hydrothermal vent metagenome]|uniref:Alanine--tRNA ligase n=1 Tax=hydrothermal vent metagenome TaxID=652676 RepID=A0A3B0UQS5_9ZZZZ
MRPTTSDEIRKAFLDYFNEQRHEVVASAPLPQQDNPTLLFTNAGMNQFADVFLGKEKRPYSRATTAQKVMRVQGKHNDLENVGPSPRHHTFFEMLGNFSFGDYFKKEAIDYAWQFVTGVLELEKERLWATVFTDDDEAFALWQRYLPAEKILRFGKEDNYWSMGDVGPRGPCSEIFCYVGDMATCDPSQLNAEDDEEFIEIWNLVFMQFNRDKEGNVTPLPKPSVDTGMGLERVVRVVQGSESNYETDLFLPLLNCLQALLGDTDAQRADKYVGYRVIADHGRAATFLITDGVRPGNTGAGYVLRMIIRRAARFGYSIGFNGSFLAEVAKVFIDQMGEVYPELKLRQEHILRTLTQEEERFRRTLESAMIHLHRIMREMGKSGASEISGEVAFDLYATYGLPLEISRDVVQERSLTVDEVGYTAAREAHAAASGKGAFGEYEADSGVYGRLLQSLQSSGQLENGVEYDPYSSAELESEIVGFIQESELVERVKVGDKVEIVTAVTPFYVESGGEVSDTGQIVSGDGTAVFRVADSRKPLNGLITHVGKVTQGAFSLGQAVKLRVDDARRSDIRRNHTATHILHQELRDKLGTHVTQAGSLVAPDRLRFDFTHDSGVDNDTLAEIESGINEAILANYPVEIEYMGQKEAIEAGAMALFGEKYGDIVRTVQIGHDGQPRYSFELCGGLHVAETNDIGLFRFTSEGAVSAGVRRVEAVTGRGARALVAERLDLLDRLAAQLNVPVPELESRVEALQVEQKSAQKRLEQMQQRLAAFQFESILAQTQDVAGVKVLTAQVEGVEVDGLRQMADRFRDNVGSGATVLATVNNGKPIIIAAVTKDLIARGVKAGDIVREVAKIVGGGGGGRPDMAQAGGKNPEKLPEALAIVPKLIAAILS